MENKCNKIQHTCGEIKPSACVEYEGEVNKFSELSDHCSLSIEETTQDIYNQLEEINLESLEDSILNYVKTTEGRVIVKNAFIKIDAEIIALKDRVTELETTDICSKNIESCNLDFNGLVDDCGDSPSTLAETLQLILDNLPQP